MSTLPVFAYLGDVLPVAEAAVQQRRQQLGLLLGRPVRLHLQEAEVALDDGVAVVGAVLAELAPSGEAVGAYPGSLVVGGLAVLQRYSNHSNTPLSIYRVKNLVVPNSSENSEN